MATAIEFNNISKIYRLGLVSTGTLAHDMKRWWTMNVRGKEDPYLTIGETNDRSTKGDSDYVWALKDIDFKVEQGDVVGIIGKNGAGKSTLLKILSKVTAPTTGTIRARGRIGSLLEVGTGFHPEMTGRENIYMNGAILGMTKHEISKKLDEIIDFSGCERYIDTPVKRYSSGMMVRLGFAVAAHLDPEILVVDEVLAVGDAEFQKKAIGKMQDVSKGEGRTVLFVSHNMGSIRQLCRNAIVLEKGRIIHQSEAHSAVDFYLSRNIEDKRSAQVIVSDEQHDKNRSLDVKFLSFTFAKEDPTFASDEDIDIEIKVTASRSKECRINCTIFNVEGTPVGSNTSMDTFQIEAGETKTLLYTIQNTRLAMGTYTISFSIGSGDASQGETNYDVVQQIIGFEIDKISQSGDSYYAKWDRGWGNIFLNTKTVEK